MLNLSFTSVDSAMYVNYLIEDYFIQVSNEIHPYYRRRKSLRED